MRIIYAALIALSVGACSQIGVQTYPMSPAQFAAMLEVVSIPPCPPGQINTVLVVELPSGGGTMSVRCGTGKVVR